MNSFRCSIVFILCISVLFACGKDSTKSIDPSYVHLQYFGFTLVDVGWDDPTDSETKTNYVDEVSAFTNIADIFVVRPDDITSRLQVMDDAQLDAILNVFFLLFEEVSIAAPSGHQYQLRSNYQARWNQFIQTNSLNTHTDQIAAFYIGEEPTWNGITSEELKAACDYVKSSFPQTPIMIIEAFPIIDQLIVPASADWVGFDQYFVKDPNTNASYQANLQLLKSKLNEDQKMVIVMDCHHYQAGHLAQGNVTLAEMGTVATNYLDLAANEPIAIALLGYFWPNGFDDPDAIGARGMSEAIQDEYRRIGKAITGK